MASNITLLKSFVDGQGAGAGTYTAYDADLDADMAAIESAFNTLAAEFRAFGGQNAALVLDLAQTATIQVGFIGALSFVNTFAGGNTQLSITKGEAMTGQGRVTVSTNPTVLTGSGSSGTRYVALRTTGVLTLETITSQGALDLYSVNWNGASFDTVTLARLPTVGVNNIIVDADDFQAARIQENFGQGTNAVLGALTYDQISKRLDDIVRVMGARLTSSIGAGQTLKAMAFGGSAATAGLMLSDGSTYDPTTGLFRQAANVLGVTVQGTEAIRFAQAAASQPQGQWRAGTSLTEPVWSFVGDTNTGMGYVASDEFRALAGGISVQEWRTVGGLPKALFPLGAVGNPTLSFIGDENTGLYSPGADRIGFASNGVLGMELTALQQRISATQGCCSATQSGTQNLANNTITNLLFDTEQYDVGAYHSTVTNTDRFTVPTGFDGLHSVSGYVTFDESTAGGFAGVGQRGVQITVNGTVVSETLVDAITLGVMDTKLPVAIDVKLVAGDIVRLTGFENAGAAMDVTTSRLTLHHKE